MFNKPELHCLIGHDKWQREKAHCFYYLTVLLKIRFLKCFLGASYSIHDLQNSDKQTKF